MLKTLLTPPMVECMSAVLFMFIVHFLILVSLQKLCGCIHCCEQESDFRFWGYIYPSGRLQDYFKLQWAWKELSQDSVQETVHYLCHGVRMDAPTPLFLNSAKDSRWLYFYYRFNMRHMPVGCGYVPLSVLVWLLYRGTQINYSTWPAVWTVGANWPNQVCRFSLYRDVVVNWLGASSVAPFRAR